MAIHLQSAYKVRVKDIENFYSSKNILLLEKIYLSKKALFDDWDVSLKFDIKANNRYSRQYLEDFCTGHYRFSDNTWLYGRVFEAICDYYGERNFRLSEDDVTVNIYSEAHSKASKSFVPLPRIKDYPEIVCISHNEIDKEIKLFNSLNISSSLNKHFGIQKIENGINDFTFFLNEAKKDKLGVAYFLY